MDQGSESDLTLGDAKALIARLQSLATDTSSTALTVTWRIEEDEQAE